MNCQIPDTIDKLPPIKKALNTGKVKRTPVVLLDFKVCVMQDCELHAKMIYYIPQKLSGN